MQTNPVYEFGPFRLDPAERLLLREDKPLALTPKMFDILLFLVERSGQVVEKEELMRAIWPDTFVEEANLTVNISSLRKVLSEVADGRHYIETVQRRGYRFEAPIKRSDEQKQEKLTNALLSNGLSSVRLTQTTAIESSPVPSVADYFFSRVGRYPRVMFFAFTMFSIIVVGLALGIYQLLKPRQSISAAPFQTMKLTRLTTNGKALEAAISPDGKYMMYILAEAGKQSLWIRQVATESNVQLVPSSEAHLGGLTFSRDGNFIYFLKLEAGHPRPALYQMPVLGGEARKLMTDISTSITLSPNGKRLAFVRNQPATKETAIIIANADGSEEQTLATRCRPEAFIRAPAWSPDGKLIACQVQTNSGLDYGLVAIPVDGGAEKIIPTQKWEASQLIWLPDGSGLVMAATKYAPGFTPTNAQLWQVSYPSGEVRRITNDLHYYSGISIAADANTLATMQRDRQSNIWLVPQGKSQLAKQITFGTSKSDGLAGLDWTPDGRIVYAANTSEKRTLWLMDADGSNAKQLTPNTKDRANAEATVSPDGRFMIYVSAFDRPHLWRMNLAGGEPQQLTFGKGEVSPQLSPDRKWVVYNSLVADKPVLMKISVEGGAPIQLTEKHSTRPVVSPDGKLIAYQHWDEQPDSPPRTVIIPFSGGAPIKSFALSPQQTVRWSPDGKGLTYIDTREGVSNLWLQPLDGSSPQQWTDFKADRIYNYAWSRDGKQLACVRGVDFSDVVLVSGFR